MHYFLEQSLNGLNLGCMYAFIALGYTMVYGVLKFVNFAHSEFFMAGGLAGSLCSGLPLVGHSLPAPLPFLLSVLVPVIVGGAVGGMVAVACEGLVYRPLRGEGRRAALLAAGFAVVYGLACWEPISGVLSGWGAAAGLMLGLLAILGLIAPYTDPPGPPRPPGTRLTGLLAALGLSLALQQTAAWAFSPDPRPWAEPRVLLTWEEVKGLKSAPADLYYWEGSARRYVAQAGEPIEPGAVASLRQKAPGLYRDIPVGNAAKQVLVLAFLVLVMAGLYGLVQHTSLGRAMRALSWNSETARLVGISPNRVIALTFFVGGALGGSGGALWGLCYGKVDPFMGFLPGLKAFIAAVVGGIGSVPGAVIGGLGLGYLEMLLAGYGFGACRDALAFAALLAVLLVRPAGLLGRVEGDKL